MFTGIVEELGTITHINNCDDSVELYINGPQVVQDAHLGDSIAVNGVCLTVTAFDDQGFSTHVMRETLSRSALSEAKHNSLVNLERAALVDSRLGGHIVQGHVDGIAIVEKIHPTPQWTSMSFALDPVLTRYIVEKGSIAVNGVSLTVTVITEESFSVSLIPTTLEHTNLGKLTVGNKVNIEVDVLAKYIEKLVRFPVHS